ncbi:hypothetical protein SLA2020_294730 [Shorea laevis]
MGHISLVSLCIFVLGFICLAPMEARKLLYTWDKDAIPTLKDNVVLRTRPAHEVLFVVPHLKEKGKSPSGEGHLERGLQSFPSPGIGHLFPLEELSAVHFPAEAGPSDRGEGHHR